MKTSTRKYEPWNSKVRSWSEIENHYLKFFGGSRVKLLELVRHIKDSDLSNRLYGSTSMDKLIVSIYNPIDAAKETLHITFDTYSGKWHFVYRSMPFQEPTFVRTYNEEQGIKKFDNFIKMIKW